NLILAAVLAVGLLRGLVGMFAQHTTRLEFQAFLLNTIWVTFSLLIVLAALAVGRETRQIRNRARIRARLPVVAWLADGRTLHGISHNLSLGGAALLVDRPEPLVLPARVDIEFNLSGQRLILPATIARWERRFLQVSWEVATIADESRVVQAVFGRADAWLDWNRYPVDRPLVSLWNVLVSIRGLFRPPGRLIATADAGPQPATAPAVAASGTLARQSFMLRPRAASAAVALLLAASMSGWPRPAHAQQPVPRLQVQNVPMPQLPPSPAPSQPQVRPQLPNMTNFQGMPQPQPMPQAQAPVSLPRPAPAPASDTRTEVLTLHDLGALGPMTMRGTSAIQGVLFGIRRDEVVTDAHLSLAGAMSPSLIPDTSNVTVTLNEQYVGTIPVTPNQPEFGPLDMPVNPVFFQDRNRLNFRFTGRYTQDCNDSLSGLLWSTVSDKSTLTLTIARLAPHRDLSRLPLPLFDENIRQRLVLPFILASNPGNDVLQAAGIVASWFGKLADFRGTRFPVSSEPPGEGNAILIATARDLPSGLALPPLAGPLVAEVANPNDPLATILVVTGRDGAEVMAAANTLSLGSRVLSGESATAQLDAVPLRKPYDAPAWIATDRPVSFGELVDASALQGTGYVPGTFHVPFRTAPDLYTWRRRPFQADIHFRAPPGPVVDLAASRLDVSINNMFLRSYSLAPLDSTLNWVMRTLGFARPVRYGSTPVPPYMVFGQNDLQMFFDARPLHRGDCVAIPDDLHMAVDPDSTLDLSNAYHYAILPNLAFFVSSGFPFTRMADLADTAVVLPQQPSPVELSAFLGLMGNFGALTFQPVNRVTVIRTNDTASAGNKDLLVVSTLAHLGPASALLERSPYRVEGATMRVLLPSALDDIWHMFARDPANSLPQPAAEVTAPLGEHTAMLIGAEAPEGNQRSVVALLAGSPQGLNDMIDAMRDTRLVPNIQGDLAVLSGASVTSYRGGGTYHVGSLPVWLWPEWWLQDQPFAITITMVLAAALLAVCFYRVLTWRAGRRTARSRPGIG
ncbi:MAG TPA: cellulose biosynthesis cyclic di-GMP-binding regulatory protein BcsB, partial [Rhodopila sp.]